MKPPCLFVFAFLHFTVFVCCLLIMISIMILEGKFSFHCGLFIDPYIEENRYRHTRFLPKRYGTCEFLLYTSGIGSIFSLILMFYYFYHTFHKLGRPEERYKVRLTLCFWINIGTWVVLLILSCIISIGFHRSCSEFVITYGISCRTMFNHILSHERVVDKTNYRFLRMAEDASWTAFVATSILISLSSFFIYRKCNKNAASSQRRSNIDLDKTRLINSNNSTEI